MDRFHKFSILALVLLSLTVGWEAFAIPATSRSTTIEPGNQQKACDYNIYQDTSFFAVNNLGQNLFKETTLQAILADTIATNVVDCIASGTYTNWGTSILTISSSGVTIEGAPSANNQPVIQPSSDVSSPSDWKGLFYDTAANFTLSSLTIDGVNVGTSPAVTVLNSNFQMQQIHIRNGFADAGIGDAVIINGNDAAPTGTFNIKNVKVINSEFSNIQNNPNTGGAFGILTGIATTVENIWFEQNYFHDNVGGSIHFDGNNLNTYSFKDVIVEANEFRNTVTNKPTSANAGDIFDQQRGAPIRTMSIVANVFLDSWGLGIGIYNSSDISIAGNSMTALSEFYNPGIAIGFSNGNMNNNDDGVTITGNTIRGYSAACDCDTATNTVFSGNTFSYAYDQELGFYGKHTNTLVSNNVFMNANRHNWMGTSNAVNETAISVFSGSASSIAMSLTIQNNMMIDNRTSHQMLYGVTFAGSANSPDFVLVKGNTFNVTTPLFVISGNPGIHDVFTDNWNLNPIGTIVSPFGTATIAGSFYCGYAMQLGSVGTGTVTSARSYIVATTDMIVTVTGGSGVSILVTDNTGLHPINGAATLTGYYIERGWTWSITFTGIPSVITEGI